MKAEEKIKLKIDKLKAQSDFHKWEYGQYNTFLIGVFAILISLFMPAVLTINGVANKLYLSVILLVLLLVSYFVLKHFSKKSSGNIRRLSKEIEQSYGSLGI